MSSMAMGSIPARGSSSRMKRGLAARQRAISRRRFSPPDRLVAREKRKCSRENSLSREDKILCCSLLFGSIYCRAMSILSCRDRPLKMEDSWGRYPMPSLALWNTGSSVILRLFISI